MEGFVVKSQTVRDGEHWLLVETMEPSRWCPSCGVAGVGNGRRRVVVRDLPIAGVPTVLVWDKRTFRCREQLCERSSWSETSSLIAVRASLTERARAEICRRVGHDLDTVAEVAREFGVGWQCAHQAVIDHGDELIAADHRIDRTVAVGVDEHTFQHANARRRTQMATTFVDIDRARLLDVVPGRSGDVVRDWVTNQPDGWADQIQVATIDAFRGYATAIGDVLPDATLVIDHFHAIRLASACVDDVRRRVQNETLGHRGRAGDPLYGIRRLLLRGYERLSARQLQRLEVGLVGDRYGEVGAAWLAKELCREIYTATDLAHARRRLFVFYDFVADAEVPELVRLAKTISTWETEILAFHTTGGLSNEPTEGINLLIKKIKRVGHGFRNFDNYRLRLLLHAGVDWHTPPTARLRGRPPRSAA